MAPERPMDHRRLPLAATLDGLPREWPADPLPDIRSALRERGAKVVVLDDDPTGVQTIHGLPVLTEWPVDGIVREFKNDLPALFLLTNSRGLSLAEARRINAQIGSNLVEAARRTGRDFVVVSRSDSTLRGHFPGEVMALAEALDRDFDAWILAPYFEEGGRYTIDDVHYVAEGELLVPAAETEFAMDPAFGYRASDLRCWVEEKSVGEMRSKDVGSISIEDIRVGGPERVARRLEELPRGGVGVVNAASTQSM